MKEANILKILESGEKDFEELKSELDIGERELKKELKNLARNGSIEKDNDSYKLKVKKTENKKNYLPFVLLALIVIFGFYLRIYHIDYQPIGYHNNKDVHYLTEARNFARDGFFKYGFFVPAVDYVSPKVDPSGAHGDTFPTTPVIVAILFSIFGIKLWVARIVGILFNTATILAIYLFVKELFKREDLALVSAVLTTILPLFVFFSHNVQLENPAVFFMVMSGYFYLRWRESFRGSELILTSLFLTLATLTKYNFLFIVIPLILTFPYKRLVEWKKDIKFYIISFIIFLLIPIWFNYSNYINSITGRKEIVSESSVKLGKFLESNWQNTQNFYIADSFTTIGAALAVIGLIFVLYTYYKNRDFGSKFAIFYSLGALITVIILADRLGGHAYYYYTIAPIVIILMAYFIVGVGDIFKKLQVDGKSIGYINWVVIAILLILLYPQMSESASRQFDTQFLGLDIAGNYLKEHKEPEERLMHSTHQAFGVLWNADMKGVKGIPNKVEDMKFAEENLNASWIFMYNWDFNKIMSNQELWGYIKSNYGLRQFAFIQTPEGNQPLYLLLRKGGTFDESKLNTLLSDKSINYKDYELTKGNQRVYYIDI